MHTTASRYVCFPDYFRLILDIVGNKRLISLYQWYSLSNRNACARFLDLDLCSTQYSNFLRYALAIWSKIEAKINVSRVDYFLYYCYLWLKHLLMA